MDEDGMRGGGTGCPGAGVVTLVDGTLVEASFVGAALVEGAVFVVGAANGALAIVGDGVGEAKEEALEGIEACEGPLPLFHAAALFRASKLVGLSTSVPSSLAMTHPLLLLLEWAMARSPCVDEVVGMVILGQHSGCCAA